MRKVLLGLGMFCLMAAGGLGLGGVIGTTISHFQPVPEVVEEEPEAEVEVVLLAINMNFDLTPVEADGSIPEDAVWLVLIEIDRSGGLIDTDISLTFDNGEEYGVLGLNLGLATSVKTTVKFLGFPGSDGDQF